MKRIQLRAPLSVIGMICGLSLSILALVQNSQAADLSPEGYWKTVPDDDANPALIKVWKENEKMYAVIVKLFFNPAFPDRSLTPDCDKCRGELKDTPVVGIKIIKGLTRNADTWSGGEILDPNNGKFYKCYIKVVDDGRRLKVRGFIGISLFGRTQYWVKAGPPEEDLPKQSSLSPNLN